MSTQTKDTKAKLRQTIIQVIDDYGSDKQNGVVGSFDYAVRQLEAFVNEMVEKELTDYKLILQEEYLIRFRSDNSSEFVDPVEYIKSLIEFIEDIVFPDSARNFNKLEEKNK